MKWRLGRTIALFSTVTTLVRKFAGNSTHPYKTRTQNLAWITGFQAVWGGFFCFVFNTFGRCSVAGFFLNLTTKCPERNKPTQNSTLCDCMFSTLLLKKI